MEESSPIKDSLYQTIEKISETKIQQEIAHNNSSLLIKQILSESKIDKLDGDSIENYETFAESLMHYMLTNALIPSQRKITLNEIEIDIIIPDIRTLGLSKKDAITILFPKTNSLGAIKARLEKIHTIQPIKENIWLVQKSNLGLPYKTYEIDGSCSFANIISDIQNIMATKPQAKFRIFKI